MRVAEDAAWRFIGLYMQLLYYAGKQRGVLPKQMTFDEFRQTPYAKKIDSRNAVYEPTLLIADFLDEATDLPDADRAAVAAWQRYVNGKFLILRHLKKHTIFMAAEEPFGIYAVLGLTTDLPDLAPPERLPSIVRTVLLPYEGVIVCDGLLESYNMLIGPTMRSNLHRDYQEARRAGKVITTL